MKTNQLVAITPESHDLKLSLAYATKDNFTGRAIYQKPLCYLHRDAVKGLEKAIELLSPLGLKLKIWDAFRPQEAQQLLFDHTPDPLYVSDPESGTCPHCRGIAVDLTITDSFGQELEMGTDFDDFRPLAHHGNDQVSEKAQYNRLLLAGVMSLSGFNPIQSEWWHYQLPDAMDYPLYTEAELQTGMV
ncbi:D-alanyl-D-alanine dipeptidase [Endozoicomonas montiporae]|uniref:D-alanyl-D-alanine dipeptidase n=2 Tax=Endozoicomonas montiporae TaxID=1027273 RepID=A0A081N7E2_9GAMM|nr:D-alanyl-D-alanine dipeptidase [Endozoicomonas montiporae]AMO55794.1 D-alanyl-D-alanine dipeptidase [Endozoicomonas montiporae CL-33]KEQ14365.1 D-alanyl-D-alanine dipeptidase [Endozoicomonas montiporae]